MNILLQLKDKTQISIYVVLISVEIRCTVLVKYTMLSAKIIAIDQTKFNFRAHNQIVLVFGTK